MGEEPNPPGEVNSPGVGLRIRRLRKHDSRLDIGFPGSVSIGIQPERAGALRPTSTYCRQVALTNVSFPDRRLGIRTLDTIKQKLTGTNDDQ